MKIQNGVSVYNGVTIEDDVFCGPHMTFTNDLYPRAFGDSFDVFETRVKKGASIGAHATIICNTTLGEYCMVGSEEVTRNDESITMRCSKCDAKIELSKSDFKRKGR